MTTDQSDTLRRTPSFPMFTHSRILRASWLMIISWLMTVPVVATDETGAWPQWRGPTRDGRVPGDTPWPDSLSADHLIHNRSALDG
jgi:hypothetical protein